ncbi:retrotransposon protein, putative, ty1-copia subclass [Tanacetum coccineum]
MQLSHAAYLLPHSVLVGQISVLIESSNGWSSRIVLTAEDKLTYLEHPIPAASVPAHMAGPEFSAALGGTIEDAPITCHVLTAHTNWVKASKEIACLMLFSMMRELQKNLEHFVAYDMLENHVFTTSRTDKLERLGHLVSLGLTVSLILTSLSNEYDEFVHNYNMHGMGKILAYAPKPKIPPPPKKDNPGKDAICHQCGEVGHWRRNYPIYLAELMKKKKQASGSITSGLRGSKMLKPVALNLYVDNGHCADVEAIGSLNLCHPNGLCIVLDNCHYAPSITRGVISVSRLNDNEFVNCFENGAILVSKDNLLYFHDIPHDVKLNLDSTLLCHCRLGHINKKRIEKLQHDGLFKSTDDESFDKCVSCKELATLLPSLTNLFVMVMFTRLSINMKSLKLFETFQREEENQLGKTIKAQRSEHGEEYMSQVFLDHLKERGIISQHTPPYTPQHNEASESLDLEEIQVEDTHPSKNTSEHHDEGEQQIVEPESDVISIRRSTRTRHAPDRMRLYVDADEHDYECGMHSMKDNQVWDLVDLPPNAKTVGNKWLLKKKTDMDGNVHTDKPRLVAKGFTQTYGVDYEGAFSPIADIRAIRILIAIATYYDYEIWQMDVKVDFFNGHLTEEVYMVQPEGFVNPKYTYRACKIQRSIYGLK